MKVYVVENRTWSQSSIEKIFLNEQKANEYAQKKESTKTFNDGYMQYYVIPHDVDDTDA